MESNQQSGKKVKISLEKAVGMLVPYVKRRFVEQVKAVWLIVLYLIIFQNIVLGIAIVQASIVSLGIVLVVTGLTFFMEGLLLGLMPLGETIGIKLPTKSKLPVILIFAFILGVGATFAEPAIGVLKVAGASVKAWDAPLLYLLLNRYSNLLVYAVGLGVGLAVVFGMLRFLYNWSLKPFIYILVPILTGLSIWAYFDPNMIYLTGLAWDCGGVTTGPVTVPLVLALGIGISRVVSKGNSSLSGFGVVTLASAFPVLTVIMLGMLFLNAVPKPMNDVDFFNAVNRDKIKILFENEEKLIGYALKNASEKAQMAYFDNDKAKLLGYIQKLSSDSQLQKSVFPEETASFQNWVIKQGTDEQKLIVFGNQENVKIEMNKASTKITNMIEPLEILSRNSIAAVQAIIPLSLLLIFTLVFVIREKLPKKDEVVLGILFSIIGMAVFSIGIEMGLSKLGSQVGEKLPSSFKPISLVEQKYVIQGFEPTLIQSAVEQDGKKDNFFYTKINNQYISLPYNESNYDATSKQYTHTPVKGPLFGKEGGLIGIFVVLLFAFIMGYGATLAEPALNALGMTVEELSVGTFKKNLLIQTVALGVGLGIAMGVAKIIWDLPLIWLLAPPYIILLFITRISSEEYVNIGWDSAGVTTGPITVPLVLAMGLGISSQVGVVDGFGILSLASVMPILAVLIVGLYVTKKRKSALQEVSQSK